MIALGTMSIMVLLTILKYEEMRSSKRKVSNQSCAIKSSKQAY